jgi:pimeloyl-ACP methyl ester carboxylesterase
MTNTPANAAGRTRSPWRTAGLLAALVLPALDPARAWPGPPPDPKPPAAPATAEPRKRPQEPTKPYPYAEDAVTYENKKAGVRLAATLTVPRGPGPFPAALLITGSGLQDRDESVFGHKPFLVLADYLTRRGVAVLRADDRGAGQSTGDFATATSADLAEDAAAGVEFLRRREEVDPRRIGLIGHSEGGLIAPMLAARSDGIAFIVLLAGQGLPGDEVLVSQGELLLKAAGATAERLQRQRDLQARLFALVKSEPDKDALARKARAILDEEVGKLSEEKPKDAAGLKAAIPGQMQMLTSPWLRYFLTYDPRPALRRVRCPVLALGGTRDLQVDAGTNLPAIEKALRDGGNADVTVKELPGLNHLFQTCATGSLAEYARIEETIAPAVLDLMAAWVAKWTWADRVEMNPARSK